VRSISFRVVVVDGGGGGRSIGWLGIVVEAFSGPLTGGELGHRASISLIFLITLERYS
jgi:hypothetical protein